MTPHDLFLAEVDRPDEQIDLAKAALYIACTTYPNLDISKYLDRLDSMGGELASKLTTSKYPLKVIQTINRYLYDELNFHGNDRDYYNPCNSFLNDVLDRRTGIPITLALVYLEVAKRIDFPMVGIGMPGHFIIRPEFEGVEIFVDAFDRGEILFAEDCRQKLMALYQQEITVLPPEVLQPVTNKQFLLRILNNLQAVDLNQPDFVGEASPVENRALVIKDWIEILIT